MKAPGCRELPGARNDLYRTVFGLVFSLAPGEEITVTRAHQEIGPEYVLCAVSSVRRALERMELVGFLARKVQPDSFFRAVTWERRFVPDEVTVDWFLEQDLEQEEKVPERAVVDILGALVTGGFLRREGRVYRRVA